MFNGLCDTNEGRLDLDREKLGDGCPLLVRAHKGNGPVLNPEAVRSEINHESDASGGRMHLHRLPDPRRQCGSFGAIATRTR